MKFFEIGADFLIPKFTRAEVRLPAGNYNLYVTRIAIDRPSVFVGRMRLMVLRTKRSITKRFFKSKKEGARGKRIGTT